jgi:sporulation protein YlmC with PRC-barrel domain
MQRELIIVLLAAVCSAGAQEDRRSTQSRTANESAEPVTRINKSSTLIGTEVRTHDNQRVGNVHDVVFDINSGRIAYYVVDAREALNHADGRYDCGIGQTKCRQIRARLLRKGGFECHQDHGADENSRGH